MKEEVDPKQNFDQISTRSTGTVSKLAKEQKSDRKSFSLRKVGLWKTYFKRSKPKTVGRVCRKDRVREKFNAVLVPEKTALERNPRYRRTAL